MRCIAPAVVLGLLTVALAAAPAHDAPKLRPAAARLTNADEVRKRLGLTPDYSQVQNLDRVKIAILDYGFDGVGGERAYLPESAVLVEHYDPDLIKNFDLGDPEYRKEFEPLNRHGRTMAQIVWAVTGGHANGPKFYLLNANGPTMLRRAVRYAIEQKVDIILFSGSFEGGGNGDGHGPINRVVADAIAANIIWINSAGNYGRRVYSGPVRTDYDGYLRFRDGHDGTVLRFRNRLDENPVTVTLTWNDYRDKEDAGTSKDLDLYVENWLGQRVGAGEKKQIAGDQVAGADESRNPRERIILTDLAANGNFNYRVRIRKKSGTFTPDDRIRVLVAAARETYVPAGSETPEDAVKFFDATGKGEIYPPADHPLVLTVGDSSPESAIGPTSDNRLKPDVVLEDSRAFFSDGQVTAGSSNAAAYVAGAVTVLKAAEPRLSARHLFRLVAPAAQTNTTVARKSYAAPRTPELLPPPAAQFRVTSPRGRTLDLQLGRSSRSQPSAPSTSATNTPLAALRSARPEIPQTLERRVWQTPSRARLAEVIRAGG